MSSTRKPVGIWIRVSTEMQARGDSPATQEQRIRQFAESQGWDVVETYRLEGVSGAISLKHSEARRMLKDLEAGRIKALVATRFARFARDGIMFRTLHQRVKKLGAELISLDEKIDDKTPAGELLLSIVADLAEFERKETSSRVRASIKPRAQAGKSLGGEAPYGYRLEGGKLVIHPDEAPVRRLVHELFLQHGRKRTRWRAFSMNVAIALAEVSSGLIPQLIGSCVTLLQSACTAKITSVQTGRGRSGASKTRVML